MSDSFSSVLFKQTFQKVFENQFENLKMGFNATMEVSWNTLLTDFISYIY